MKIKYFYFISLAVIAFDLLTKYLTDGIIFQQAIPGIFSIESHHNTGASFSIFAGSTFAQIMFIILAFAFIAGVIVFDCLNKKIPTNGWYIAGVTLMLGGVIGNLYDRIVFGYVRDFISLDFINFAIFNVADTCLCVGVVCLAIWLIFFTNNSTKEENNGNKNISS